MIDLRAAMGQLIGRPLSGDDWRLASLGIAAGGLGARCAAEHAPAAYVASFSACRELCGQLWPAFDPFDLDEGCHLAAAEEALRSAIPSGANIYAESDSPSQRSLSGMIEAQSVSGIFGDPTLPRHRRLHLEACRVPGAGAWLTANPSCVDSHVPSSLFRVALQRRLRMPLWDHDSACSMCGEVLDRWGDHALSCCCGRWVLRHNAVRNVVCSAVAEFTSVSPELEKPGLLLPPRPPDPGGTHPDVDPSFVSPLRLPPVAALPISGFPGAFLAALKPGISRFLRCSAPLTSPRPLHLLPMSSMRWRPGSAPSRTRLHWLLSAGPPSAHLSWRLAGAGGPKPFGALWLGLPPSPARPAAWPPTYPRTPASGLHSASAAPFTGKTRVQS